MKKYKILFSFFLVALIFSATSCKWEETQPLNYNTDDMVWNSSDPNAALAIGYLRGVYNSIPDGFNRINSDFLDAATDDAIPSRNNTPVGYYTNGTVTALNDPDTYYGKAYSGIRSANVFLANIDRVPAGMARITYWKAEVRFIRVLLYFELLKRYGGIPLIGDKVFTVNDDLTFARNTFSDCVDYIVNECVAIKPNLRLQSAIPSGEYGSISQGAAIALKCRVLLYAASPLYNGGGVESNQAIKTLTGYPTADPSRWQKVVDAAEEFNTLGYYGLQASFTTVFTAKQNIEIILARQSANSSIIETNNAPIGYTTPSSLGYTSPTQNYVDAFPMMNGLSINDPASGYLASKPYTSRDPRLAASVFYNGVTWLSKTVETFEGGKDKPNMANTVQTKTGYYLRKFMGDFTTATTYSSQSHNFPVFRYAEIILNYAESLNEVNRIEDAVKQIILVRKRAGIQAGANSRYGIRIGILQGEMRDLIRNERRVELAFEEHRFWDVRRWKVAATALSGPIYGAQLTKDMSGNVIYDLHFQVASYRFSNKLYHMPLPYSETTKNANLIQNEGW
jgi:hypothetical protein